MGRRSDEEEAKQAYQCFCKILSVFISATILLYFTISVALPTCSVQEFYVAALNKAVNTTTPSDIIFFDIKLDNKNKAKGVQYAPINLTFYYGSDNSFPVGSYVVPGFYQGIKKDTRRRDVVDTRGVPWKVAIGLVSNGSTASFRVGMATTVRFKFLGILNRKHKMDVGATVKIDDSGEKVSKDGIKFKSGATSVMERGRRGWVGLAAVVIAFVFMF